MPRLARAAAATRYLGAAWGPDAASRLPSLVTADFRFVPPEGGVERDLAWWLGHLAAMRAAFTPEGIDVLAVVAASPRVAVHYSLRARHTGDAYGMPPSGQPGRLVAIAILAFAGARVARHVEVADFFSARATRFAGLS